jgi:hypothetical protein
LTAQFRYDIFLVARVHTARGEKNKMEDRGNLRMKKFSIVTAIAMFAAMTAPAFASCDTHAEDDQAVCASKCEDAYLKDQQGWTADMSKVKESKKACDEKCGCPQNSKGL